MTKNPGAKEDIWVMPLTGFAAHFFGKGETQTACGLAYEAVFVGGAAWDVSTIRPKQFCLKCEQAIKAKAQAS